MNNNQFDALYEDIVERQITSISTSPVLTQFTNTTNTTNISAIDYPTVLEGAIRIGELDINSEVLERLLRTILKEDKQKNPEYYI